MSAKRKVGASLDRTVIKHKFLRKVSGAVTGAGTMLPGTDQIIFIDGCAGDGKRNEFSGTSSPEIFATHLHWLYKRGFPGKGYLIESDKEIFRELENSIPSIAQQIGFPELPAHLTLINDDYRSADVANKIGLIAPNAVCFLYIDPNNVDRVELSPELCALLPKLTSWMVTLGCNASGVKRSPPVNRDKWLKRLVYLLGFVYDHQDACLVTLDGDSSQWAYLLNIPYVWRHRIEKDIDSLQKLWPHGLHHYWHSDGQLLPAAKELFLTKAELSAIRQLFLF
jgi:hypothetical protein